MKVATLILQTIRIAQICVMTGRARLEKLQDGND